MKHIFFFSQEHTSSFLVVSPALFVECSVVCVCVCVCVSVCCAVFFASSSPASTLLLLFLPLSDIKLQRTTTTLTTEVHFFFLPLRELPVLALLCFLLFFFLFVFLFYVCMHVRTVSVIPRY